MNKWLVYIRSFLYALFGIISMVLYSIPCMLICLLPVGFSFRYRFMVFWPKMMIWAARWIAGIRWQVKGVENIPHFPVVVCSKHQSVYETLFFPWYMPLSVCYVHKRSLNYIPFFGWAFSRLKHIAIDRSKPTEAIRQLVSIGSERIQEGRMPVIFPEGTRVPVGQRMKYQTGAARMAMAQGIPILPVAHNAGVCWPAKSYLVYPGTVTISFGPLIQTAGKSQSQIMQEVEIWIETEQLRLLSHS